MSHGPRTESWWAGSGEPLALVEYVRVTHRMTRTQRGRRKLRLFACGCCRRAEPLFAPGDGLRDLLAAVEAFTDGRLADRPWVAVPPQPAPDVTGCLRAAVAHTRAADIIAAVKGAVEYSYYALRMHAGITSHDFWEREHRWQADLLRCVAGNPFRPVTFDPTWLTPTVIAMSEAIYADRAFDRLPILADALEESGCDNADVLTHCRGPGPHVRGCWVVDLVLGKG